jgi:NAD(P)-dependent dehydrogenase (short-subunit alcohol dehydrogenase family)
MISKTVETYGRLDCAHNNAGIAGRIRAPLHECPEDVWDQVLAINLKGVWLCMKYEISQMLHQSNGAIVNTASIMGLVGSWSGTSAYNASKHGVVGLTKTAALEYASAGIRVNAMIGVRGEVPLVEELATAADVQSFVRGHVRWVDGTPGPAIELEDIDWTTVDWNFVLKMMHVAL